MIIKYFNLKPDLLKENKIVLFYGNNEGLKNEVISKLRITPNYHLMKKGKF